MTRVRNLITSIVICLGTACFLQPPSAAQAAAYPVHLPYRFTNLIWWSDEELRSLLRARIPGLGNEIATTSAAEGRVRDALRALLKEKGIVAEVQSEEPSQSSIQRPMGNLLGMQDDDDSPPPPQPAIDFSVLRPAVVVGKINVQSDVAELAPSILQDLNAREGGQYGEPTSFSRFLIERSAKRRGYLGAQLTIRHGEPYQKGDSYATDLTVAVTSGPQYRISSLTVDGGSLFAGKDFSPLIQAKAGDPAGESPFFRVGLEIHEYYQQHGYADVALNTSQVLDAEHATVAYSLRVVPGPIYHLRSLTVKKLSLEQESRVRELLAMKSGDLYRDAAITDLYRRVANDPLLKGFSFGYSPKPDRANAVVDLSLDFYRRDGDANVTKK